MAPRAPALILGALCGASWLETPAATVVEDTLAFFQRAVTQTGLESDDLEHALPVPGRLGLTVLRKSASVAPGNTFKLSFKPFCEGEDAYGHSKCVVYYGSFVNTSVELDINPGVESGDTVYSSMEGTLTYNKADPLAKFVSPTFKYVTQCEVCNGTCVEELLNPNISIKLTSPTRLDGDKFCGAQSGKGITLSPDFVAFWVPPGKLAPEGNVDFSFSLTDSGGSNKVAGEYEVSFSQSASAAMLVTKPEEMTKQSPAAMLVTKPEEMTKQSLWWFVGRAMGAVAEDDLARVKSRLPHVPGAAAALSLVKENTASATHSLIFDLDVTELENGNPQNISITFDSGCTSIGTIGSLHCEFPLGQGPVTASGSFKLSTIIGEGDVANFTMQTKLGGNFGTILSHLLLPAHEWSSPLCGDDQRTDFLGKSFKYKLAKCGHHSLELDTVDPISLTMKDFEDLYFPYIPLLPYLPKSVDGLLPVSMVLSALLTHKDGSKIANVTLTMSIAEQ